MYDAPMMELMAQFRKVYSQVDRDGLQRFIELPQMQQRERRAWWMNRCN